MILSLTRDTILQALGIAIPTPILEILDVIVISLALGFIFKDIFKAPAPVNYDPLHDWKNKAKNNFKFALMVTAPAVVLHEAGHKFVAMAFGIPATFYASYGFLILGVILRALNFGFIFFVPGFVSHGPAPVFQSTLISLSGPAVNLLIWIFSSLALKSSKIESKYRPFFILTKKINMFLFIFNMIPIPPFDGAAIWNVFRLF